MNKTLQTSFEIQVISAYEEFNWSLLRLRKDGAFDSHQKPHNLQIYSMFNKKYPNVCPTFEYFRFMANCKLKYNDSIETFLNSYICPICKERPKKDICNSGRNGKYKGKTCKRKECHIELRKRTNLSKGGNSCALHRTDVKPKVEASFKRNWGVQYAGQSEEIRNKWQKTNLEKTGYAFQFQNPETQKKVRDTWKNMSIERKQYILQKKSEIASSPEFQRKRALTLKKNNSFNVSRDEEIIYKLLLSLFKKVKRQYTDKNRYPYACDFYIPEKDLFIEYQGYFTHGKEPYTGTARQQERVKYWEQKGKALYTNAIKIWTQKDCEKRNTAIKNNLNWVEFFNLQEFREWFIKIRDKTIKARIKSFLRKNGIKFIYKNDIFKLFKEGEQKSSYYMRYISPEKCKMKIPSLGIDGLSKNYFFYLQEELERKGIFCNFIRSYEWLNKNKRQILKSSILHKMGKTPIVFYARDCEVKVFTNAEIKSFQQENCFYGYRNSSSLCLGLVLKKDKNGLNKGTIVEIMTFGLNFFGKKKDIEVHRVGSLKNTYTVGGMSKLLKYFFTHYEYDTIVYYLDWCHHSGMSLTKDIGFDLITKSASFHNYDILSMESFGRRPSKHKEIMRKVARGSVISVPIVGTKTFRIKHQVT